MVGLPSACPPSGSLQCPFLSRLGADRRLALSSVPERSGPVQFPLHLLLPASAQHIPGSSHFRARPSHTQGGWWSCPAGMAQHQPHCSCTNARAKRSCRASRPSPRGGLCVVSLQPPQGWLGPCGARKARESLGPWVQGLGSAAPSLASGLLRCCSELQPLLESGACFPRGHWMGK